MGAEMNSGAGAGRSEQRVRAGAAPALAASFAVYGGLAVDRRPARHTLVAYLP